MKRFTRAALITGIAAFMMAASASAAIITFDTDATGTGFVGAPGDGYTLTNTSGALATLTYTPVLTSDTGVPSNVNYGNFTLVCSTCSITTSSTFGAFVFNLVLTDHTDGANGTFVGTSSGGVIFSNVSPINISWLPKLLLGPGTTNSNGGSSFGPTSFLIDSMTGIVAPNSGEVPGQTTIEGYVNSSTIPEPATFGLMGAALIGLGLSGRRRMRRQ